MAILASRRYKILSTIHTMAILTFAATKPYPKSTTVAETFRFPFSQTMAILASRRYKILSTIHTMAILTFAATKPYPKSTTVAETFRFPFSRIMAILAVAAVCHSRPDRESIPLFLLDSHLRGNDNSSFSVRFSCHSRPSLSFPNLCVSFPTICVIPDLNRESSPFYHFPRPG